MLIGWGVAVGVGVTVGLAVAVGIRVSVAEAVGLGVLVWVFQNGYLQWLTGDYTVTVEASDTSGLACGVATDTTTVRARARD